MSTETSSELELKYKGLFDDRYSYPGRYNMLHYKNNGHLKLDAEFTPSELGNLYSNYYPRTSFNIDSWAPHTEKANFSLWFNGNRANAFRWVPRNVKVLDIGCGFGETLGYHKARGCNVYGVEADNNIQRVADKFGFNVKVGLFDGADFEKESFDYITLDQVIEHVSDPVKVMNDVYTLLKPGGIVVVSTPNSKGWGVKFFGRKWVHWHTPYHLNIFSKESMIDLSHKTGFIFERSTTITNSEWLYYQWLHLITYPKYGVPSSFWSTKRVRTFNEKVMIKLVTIIHKLKFNHLVTRLFDELNYGDNRIYFLKKPV